MAENAQSPFSDNPSQGLIPLSITPFCMARLNGWIRVIEYFLKYLSIVVDNEQKWAQFYTLSSTNMNNILESDFASVFGPKETFPTFLKAFSDNQISNSDNRTSVAVNINTQLLPIFKELLDQVKRKISDPTDGWTSLDIELNNDLEKYRRLKNNLRSILVRYEDEDASSPRDLAKDPFLANTAIQEHIRICNTKQEVYRVRIQAVRDDLSAFEAVIIQNLKVSITSYLDWTSTCALQYSEQIQLIKQIIEDLKPEDDWKQFEACNRGRFIDKQPLVSPESIVYDGFDDPIMEPAMKGILMRKDGIFKRSFKKCYGVLTKSNFLHFFQEAVSGKNPILGTPDLSIDLSETTLSPMMMNEKEPEEITLTGRVTGMFSREVSYKFKGVNMSASAEWWGSIDEQMKQFKVNRLAVLKKKGGNPDSINIQRLSLRKGSKSSKNSGSKTELAEFTTPRISVGETSKPMKPPLQPELNTQSAVPIYTSTVAPQADGPSIYVNDFAAFPPLTQSLTDEERRLANMTVTERMEYELQKKVSASSAVQSNFDSPANSAFAYNSPTNAWDSLGGGNEGGW